MTSISILPFRSDDAAAVRRALRSARERAGTCTIASPAPTRGGHHELHRCGLSAADAGVFLISPSTGEPTEQRVVRRWLSGEFEIPAHHWQKLQTLCDQQDRAAEEQLALIRKLVAEYGEDPREIVIRLSRTQEDADRLGWPTPGAHLAAIRRVVERAPEGLRIIPVYPGEEPAAEAASIARGMID